MISIGKKFANERITNKAISGSWKKKGKEKKRIDRLAKEKDRPRVSKNPRFCPGTRSCLKCLIQKGPFIYLLRR